MRSGKLNQAKLQVTQMKLDTLGDVFAEKTADEEEAEAGQEENEVVEDEALEGVIATTLAELEAELRQVEYLCDLARKVYEAGTSRSLKSCAKFCLIHSTNRKR